MTQYEVGKKYEWYDDGTVSGAVREEREMKVTGKGMSFGDEVCDECLLVAYDEGLRGKEQDLMMVDLGSELPDHLCDEIETDGEVYGEDAMRCGCSCKQGAKRQLRSERREI